MIVMAIDPGSAQSAWLHYDTDTGRPCVFGIIPNDELLATLRHIGAFRTVERVIIEWTAPRGMPASAELFETLWWAGQFAEAARPVVVERLKRLDVKRLLCGTTAANDTNVRAALIDRFGGAGGKAAAIGLKASPGPLHGISKDAWSALAIAVVWSDMQAGR